MELEAVPMITYQIENKPELQEIGTIVIHTTLVVGSVDMDPILARSRFSCSLPATEFIEDEASPSKRQLYNFLTELGVDEFDAITLLQKLIQIAITVTSFVEYCPHYGLSMWLTLDVVPLNQEPVLDDSQIEEATGASLDDYEGNIGFRPASKLGVGSLSRRIYKRRPKTSLDSDSKTKRKTSLVGDIKTKRKTRIVSDSKTKRKTCSISNHCTICLEEFKNGQKVGTLPCGHEFDNKCIMKWLKVNHVCPLCRYELPCEEDDFSQTTTVF